MSHGLAQSLQLPYTVKEAWGKYRKLKNLCKSDWQIENNEHAVQMKLCISILELGKNFKVNFAKMGSTLDNHLFLASYMLPGEFLTSGDCKAFVKKCMKNDLLLALKNIREGRRYVAPCALISSIISKVSTFCT